MRKKVWEPSPVNRIKIKKCHAIDLVSEYCNSCNNNDLLNEMFWAWFKTKIRDDQRNKLKWPYGKPKQCCKCGKETKLEIHHVIPVSCGGDNRSSNIIMLCNECHKSVPKSGMLEPQIVSSNPTLDCEIEATIEHLKKEILKET